MKTVFAFAVLGLIVHQAVAFVRNGFDKYDRIPKVVWNLLPWALGLILGWVLCGFNHKFSAYFDLPTSNCVGYVLAGLGFGSVASFWHSVLGALSKNHPSENPMGFKARPRPPQ